MPLSPTGLLQQGSGHTAASAPAPQNNNREEGNASLQPNGNKIPTGREDQHASKLHFFQGEHEADLLCEIWEDVFAECLIRVYNIVLYFWRFFM